MKIVVVIPARLKSTRLPEKPLVNIEGKSMIKRTYERTIQAWPEEDVYVATDHEKIYTHCKEEGINVLMTSDQCLTGTDRVAEVADQIDADYYVNVQGDEPLIDPQDIKDVISSIDSYSGEIINGYTAINDKELYESVSIPKVVFRPDGRLLYMSRSKIPGNKADEFIKSWRQVCIYAFPKEALKAFANATSKTELEELEDIEILRFLEMGYEVRMVKLSDTSVAVDNPEDVEKVVNILRNGK